MYLFIQGRFHALDFSMPPSRDYADGCSLCWLLLEFRFVTIIWCSTRNWIRIGFNGIECSSMIDETLLVTVLIVNCLRDIAAFVNHFLISSFLYRSFKVPIFPAMLMSLLD